jgi:signal transduction histidine kinase
MTMTDENSELHRVHELEQEKIILQEMNDFLEQHRAQINTKLSSISHEFRTPLVVIKSYVDMLLVGKYGSITVEQRKKLEMVQTNTNTLINAIFDTISEKESFENG